MDKITTREFAKKTASTAWMVGIGVGAFVGAEAGVIPGSAAQVIIGGVAYDVTKFVTWVIPRAVNTFVVADCDCVIAIDAEWFPCGCE